MSLLHGIKKLVRPDAPAKPPAYDEKARPPLRVFERFPKIPHISEKKAQFLYDLVVRYNCQDCLELGFSHGKSTAVLAQAMEDKGSGHVTTMDLPVVLEYRSGINRVLPALGLSHRVTVRTDPEGFHWSLMELLEAEPRPSFDFVFLDGAHTWAGTGFAFLLVEKLLRPGAWVIFDDVFWTIAANEARRQAKGQALLPIYTDLTERERTTPQIKKVFDLLVTPDRYTDRAIRRDLRIGIARRK